MVNFTWACLNIITDQQENVEAHLTETVTQLPEIAEPEEEATWLKDNVPLSVSEEKSETTNKDYFYQFAIPDIKVEDVDEHRVQEAYESLVPLIVIG